MTITQEKPAATNIVGGSLRRQRQAAHQTVRGLADLAGISHGHLSDIENGKAEPSADMLHAIVEGIVASYKLPWKPRPEDLTCPCVALFGTTDAEKIHRLASAAVAPRPNPCDVGRSPFLNAEGRSSLLGARWEGLERMWFQDGSWRYELAA